MKKKHLIFIATVMLIAAYVSLGIFALAQEKTTVSEEQSPINGVWRVVSYHSGDQVTLLPYEFMVFEDGRAADYRDRSGKPYAESAYAVEGSQLVLSDLGRSYQVNRCSEHVMQLYSNKTEYMELVWYKDMETVSDEADRTQLQGKWNIAYRRGLDQIGTEILIFDAGALKDYRNGSAEPTVVADYSWNADGELTVQRIAKIYRVYPADANEWYLVETDTGYIWQLVRAE